MRADLGAVFDGANTRLLAVTASVVALLLIITYRSPVLWLVPLIVVGIADRFAAVRNNPPMLYHNDLSASVSRRYWSEDVGYAMWLRIFLGTGG